ncbi:hypothetical protein [Amycolatopsis jejuensis]|uniref:hypothetical protein n=1 Tax=Amycolatopsis jejuensis TaxID=330084 RepID=UPI0005255BF9|nr:hypothetical protein [Amycolatopsis jejuensis]
MKSLGTWIRAAITLVLLVIAALWLLVVYTRLGTPSTDGTAFDEFQRAKDILLVVLPLLTTALGYWFGSAGRQQAERKADQAKHDADKAQRKLAGVLDSSAVPDLLEKAKNKDPEAFGLPVTH